jgi:hypothetical protein
MPETYDPAYFSRSVIRKEKTIYNIDTRMKAAAHRRHHLDLREVKKAA